MQYFKQSPAYFMKFHNMQNIFIQLVKQSLCVSYLEHVLPGKWKQTNKDIKRYKRWGRGRQASWLNAPLISYHTSR